MKIAVASDHAGFKLKKGILDFLSSEGFEYEDFGCDSEEPVDYIDYAKNALEHLFTAGFDRAILFCGTGLGMAIVANKFKGVRATPCWDEYTAEVSRKHNDSNCLTLGGRVLPLDEAVVITRIWLESGFEKGRHQGRIDKISSMESSMDISYKER